jgi:hypothetical protein
MTPILLYALIAAGLGWSIHKKKWGIAVFCGAILVWMLAMQLIIALSMRPVSF